MRIRRVDLMNGDRLFGSSQLDYYHDIPEAVALLVLYRLRLNLGEWFADTTQGTPWATRVLGERTQATRDIVVREQVQTTQGVAGVVAYASQTDRNLRTWDCQMTIDTIYGGVNEILRWLPAEVPRPKYGLLGVVGDDVGTEITMRRADLSTGRSTDIADFEIMRVDVGQW